VKVAVVCGAPSTQHLVPHDNPEWEIWVLGNRLDKYKGKRVTRVFEIHDKCIEEHGPQYPNWLVSQGYPVVVGQGFPIRAENVQFFPFEEVEGFFGRTYLTSSTAYMMALAILEGAKEIGVYGSDMSVDDHEYFWQRPCLEAWIGFARGRGIKVHIPEQSPIGRCDYVEGRGSSGKPEFAKPPFTQAAFTQMAAQHAQRVQQIEAQVADLRLQQNAHSGAQQAYERLSKVARAVEAGIDVKSLNETAVIK
jgi:hypothetical protein